MHADKQLSRYFTRHQVIQGTALPPDARQLNWKHFDDYLKLEEKYILLCQRLDDVILDINAKFIQNNYATLTLGVASGFRCLPWELKRNRSGHSQHTIGAALDVYPVSNSLTDPQLFDVIQYITGKYQKSWQGGFAVKAPVLQNGRLVSTGFIHFDNRQGNARWTY